MSGAFHGQWIVGYSVLNGEKPEEDNSKKRTQRPAKCLDSFCDTPLGRITGTCVCRKWYPAPVGLSRGFTK